MGRTKRGLIPALRSLPQERRPPSFAAGKLRGFPMCFNLVHQVIYGDHNLTQSEKLVLIVLAEHAKEDHGWECWPTVERLMRASCSSRRTVQRALRSLEDMGYIRIAKHSTGRPGEPTTYWVNAEYVARGASVTPVEGRQCDAEGASNTTQTGASVTPKPVIEPVREPVTARTAKKRATRMPDDFPLKLDRDWATSKGLSEHQVNREVEKFTEYWGNKTGQGSTKLDWSKTWKVWVNNAIDRGWVVLSGGERQLTDMEREVLERQKKREGPSNSGPVFLAAGGMR